IFVLSLPDYAFDLLATTLSYLVSKHSIIDMVHLQMPIKNLNAQQDVAAKAEDFEKAANLKKEIADKQHQLEGTNNEKPVVATPNDVAVAVERLTGIPVSKLGASD
ncbi:UvrB/UvrC motif-containing protein, partial [Enterobacter quasiroggenkampii]|nr:UvrB/UvrC motif-containing protein [Enterobacter quasiroggenkampii]